AKIAKHMRNPSNHAATIRPCRRVTAANRMSADGTIVCVRERAIISHMDRRDFLYRSLLLIPAARAASAQSFDLEEATLADLEQGFAARKFTARAVAEWYLARIDLLDKKGPKVNSVIELNPDALSIADALDRERA